MISSRMSHHVRLVIALTLAASCTRAPPPRADCPAPKACIPCPAAERAVCPSCDCDVATAAPEAPSTPSRGTLVAPDAGAAAAGVKARHAATLDTLPAGTAVAVTLDVGAALDWLIDEGLGALASENVASLRARLSASLLDDLGVDLTRADFATAWLVPSSRGFAVWLDGDFGAAATRPLTPAARATEAVAGAPALPLGDSLWLTMMGARVVIGNAEGLRLSRAAGATLQADFTMRQAHAGALGHIGDGPCIASMALVAGSGTFEVKRALRWLTGLEPEAVAIDGAAFALGRRIGIESAFFGQDEAVTALMGAMTRLAPRWRSALSRHVSGAPTSHGASLADGLVEQLQLTRAPGLLRIAAPPAAFADRGALPTLIALDVPAMLRDSVASEVGP
jgi:hypothetical protein